LFLSKDHFKQSSIFKDLYFIAGVFSGGVTPDPIPNSEVKPACGDGIALVTVWESSTTPASFLWT
jgi:hypothetical protein